MPSVGEKQDFDKIAMMNKYRDIQGIKDWKLMKPITKGWSSDEKYYIETDSNETYILRISDSAQYEKKKKEYEMIQKFNKLDVKMSQAISFGICNQDQKVYMLLTWVEGQDLEEVLPRLSEVKQYQLGQQAGKILKKFHSIEVANCDIPVETKITKKKRQLERYLSSNVRMKGDEEVVQFVDEHIDEIWSLPPVYQHGDFHPGNLVLMENFELGVIDFNRFEVGDPYEEFYKLESFGTELSIPYCRGQIDAYFNGDVPEEFWRILAVYVAHASLYSIKWAEPYGQADIDGMKMRYIEAMKHYNNFKDIVPSWY